MINYEEQQVKNCLRDYLISKFGNIDKMFCCPNPEHDDKNASAKYYADTNTVYCYGCQKHYDIFNLLGFEYGLDNKEAYKKGFELFGKNELKNHTYSKAQTKEKIEEINFEQKFEEWHKALLQNRQALNYLYSRGISDKTIEKFKLGFKQDYQTITIPTSSSSYNSRSIKCKIYFKEGASNIFNKSCLYSDKDYCIITEGEFDCMSFVECGFNAIGLGGVGLIKKLSQLDLPKNMTYILVLDRDIAGRNATKELEHLFSQRELRFLTSLEKFPYKDPNEYLTHDKTGFMKFCEKLINQAKGV